jgi:hypothetical protein
VKLQRLELARWLWAKRKPIRGSIAETYLRAANVRNHRNHRATSLKWARNHRATVRNHRSPIARNRAPVFY